LAHVMESSWEAPLRMASGCLRGLPSPLSLLPLRPSLLSSWSSPPAPSPPAPSNLLPRMFHGHFVSVSFLIRSDSQPFCASMFLWLLAGNSFSGEEVAANDDWCFPGKGRARKPQAAWPPAGSSPF